MSAISPRGAREALALAIFVALAAHAISSWIFVGELWRTDVFGLRSVPWRVVEHVMMLAVALLLGLPSRRRSGLVVGSIREHWKRVLLVCSLGPLATAAILLLFPAPPFSRFYFTSWLISPFAQELVFLGYIYGILEAHFGSYVHHRVRVRWALVITAALFGLWHVPGILRLPLYLALAQIFYTGVLSIIPGLSRQWTGSILYATLSHSLVNFLLWWFAAPAGTG